MKDLQRLHSILLVLFTIALIFGLAMIGSLKFKESVLPILSINRSQASEGAAGPAAHIHRIQVPQGVKIVKDESSKLRTLSSLEKQLVLQAKNDLANRLSVKKDKVTLLEIRAVTWPDSSLGCPKAGEVYDQTSQKGFLIRLKVGDSMYFYHSAGTVNPFLCEQTARIVPHPRKDDEFIPHPGIDID